MACITQICDKTSPNSPCVSHSWLVFVHIFATFPHFFLASKLCLSHLTCSPLCLFVHSFLGCAPSCSYMDSKFHLRELSRPLGCVAPLRGVAPQQTDEPFRGLTRPNKPMHPFNLCVSCDCRASTLGVLLVSTHPTLFGVPLPCVRLAEPTHILTWHTPSLGCFHPMFRLMLGKSPWRVQVPTCPTTVTLEFWNDPKFHLLEDLGEGVHTLLVEGLTITKL